MTRLPEPGIVVPRFMPAGLPKAARGDEFKPHLMELTGTVTDNYSNGSDPVLCVSDAEGRNWTVELAGRARNAALGLTKAVAFAGRSDPRHRPSHPPLWRTAHQGRPPDHRGPRLSPVRGRDRLSGVAIRGAAHFGAPPLSKSRATD